MAAGATALLTTEMFAALLRLLQRLQRRPPPYLPLLLGARVVQRRNLGDDVRFVAK
jgi:hypothetical protein